MDQHQQQPPPTYYDSPENLVTSQYIMYPSSSEHDIPGYLVYPQTQQTGYTATPVVHSPAAPPWRIFESDPQQAMHYHRSIHMMTPQHVGAITPGVYSASPPSGVIPLSEPPPTQSPDMCGPPPQSPDMHGPLPSPTSESDASADGIYHSGNNSTPDSPASFRGTSLVQLHPLRHDLTHSPTSSICRRSRGYSISDDDDRDPMGRGGVAASLAKARKEATRVRRVAAERERRDKLREWYAKLKDALPVVKRGSSKISLLKRATDHIAHLEQENGQLQQDIAALTAEVARLRGLNEKISFGVIDAPLPGQVSRDSRPWSPPPDGTQPQSSDIHQPLAESSPSAS